MLSGSEKCLERLTPQLYGTPALQPYRAIQLGVPYSWGLTILTSTWMSATIDGKNQRRDAWQSMEASWTLLPFMDGNTHQWNASYTLDRISVSN